MSYAGISFEAEMTAEQAAELAQLMEEARPTRPEGVVTALLEYADGAGGSSPSGTTPRRSTATSPRPTSRAAPS